MVQDPIRNSKVRRRRFKVLRKPHPIYDQLETATEVDEEQWTKVFDLIQTCYRLEKLSHVRLGDELKAGKALLTLFQAQETLNNRFLHLQTTPPPAPSEWAELRERRDKALDMFRATHEEVAGLLRDRNARILEAHAVVTGLTGARDPLDIPQLTGTAEVDMAESLDRNLSDYAKRLRAFGKELDASGIDGVPSKLVYLINALFDVEKEVWVGLMHSCSVLGSLDKYVDAMAEADEVTDRLAKSLTKSPSANSVISRALKHEALQQSSSLVAHTSSSTMQPSKKSTILTETSRSSVDKGLQARRSNSTAKSLVKVSSDLETPKLSRDATRSLIESVEPIVKSISQPNESGTMASASASLPAGTTSTSLAAQAGSPSPSTQRSASSVRIDASNHVQSSGSLPAPPNNSLCVEASVLPSSSLPHSGSLATKSTGSLQAQASSTLPLAHASQSLPMLPESPVLTKVSRALPAEMSGSLSTKNIDDARSGRPSLQSTADTETPSTTRVWVDPDMLRLCTPPPHTCYSPPPEALLRMLRLQPLEVPTPPRSNQLRPLAERSNKPILTLSEPEPYYTPLGPKFPVVITPPQKR